MAEILTTGPMLIPRKITGDPVGDPPDVVIATIVNPTNKILNIQLFVDVYNIITGTITTIPDIQIILRPHFFITRTLSLDTQTDDILRFYAEGDLDEDAEKLELSFVGQRSSDQMNEPTLLFRHENLIKVKNKHSHRKPDSTLDAAVAHYWKN